jgi:hypothetical protein
VESFDARTPVAQAVFELAHGKQHLDDFYSEAMCCAAIRSRGEKARSRKNQRTRHPAFPNAAALRSRLQKTGRAFAAVSLSLLFAGLLDVLRHSAIAIDRVTLGKIEHSLYVVFGHVLGPSLDCGCGRSYLISRS